ISALDVVFNIIGGLGLFIYGIHLMGEGLQKIAGAKLRQILKILADKPIKGVILGTGITVLIQSSSATTVMVVGFVNAGLMTLTQSVGVIMGANIGTTVTAQLIAFKITQYTLPAIGAGLALNLFAKKKIIKDTGQFILGFGILFLGFQIMKSPMTALRASGVLEAYFMRFSNNPFLALLAGLVATMILQSSSATIGIVMALAVAGLSFRAAIPILLGCNIGTCVTVSLASIGATLNAKRAALAHVIFNVIGAMMVFSILPFYVNFIQWLTGFLSFNSGSIDRQIANAHTIFNIANTIFLLPFVGLMVKVIRIVIPGEDKIAEGGPRYLEEHLLNTPSIAIEQTRKEILRMLSIAREMVRNGMNGFFNKDKKSLLKIPPQEAAVDNLQEAITHYLVRISERDLSSRQSEQLPALMHAVNDIERIGDHAENLAELAEREINKKLSFTKMAVEELHRMYDAVDKMINETFRAFEANDFSLAQEVLAREGKVNSLYKQLRQNHIQRLNQGTCYVLSGIVFLDLLNNFEKMGDHLANIAEATSDILQP
ncbi:MAG: Na/Pi cotransporter family protein, partial [Candidatus Omnitrophota bacterium]|nr:Na/Pi cotransporter family protein [Candidatus Omnitrophota bacterium]